MSAPEKPSPLEIAVANLQTVLNLERAAMRHVADTLSDVVQDPPRHPDIVNATVRRCAEFLRRAAGGE